MSDSTNSILGQTLNGNGSKSRQNSKKSQIRLLKHHSGNTTVNNIFQPSSANTSNFVSNKDDSEIIQPASIMSK